MPGELHTPAERRAAEVASFREAFDAFVDTFFDRRTEANEAVAPTRLDEIRTEYLGLRRRVVAAYHPIRDAYLKFLAEEPHHDLPIEFLGDDPNRFADYFLTEWWSPPIFDEAYAGWLEADDNVIALRREQDQGVLDAFANWAAETHEDDEEAAQLHTTGPQEPIPPASRGSMLGRVLNHPWAIAIGSSLIVGLILLGVTIWLTGDSDSSANPATSSTAEPDPTCTVTGQAFDLDGSPISGARVIARDPEAKYYEQVGSVMTPLLGTTNGEGRFSGSCDSVETPFLIAIAWEPVIGRGEWCEWWGVRVDNLVEDEEGLRDVNIQIPREDVESGAYHYTDDYGCTYLDS